MRLLSIDWDFFLPYNLMWDWSTSERQTIFYDLLWYIRGEQFVRMNQPLPGLSNDLEMFWNRFKFTKTATLSYAESHMEIIKVLPGMDTVHSYDAHHDAGYRGVPKTKFVKEMNVQCDDWARAAVEIFGINVLSIYPRWRNFAETTPDCKNVKIVTDTGKKEQLPFDEVFICRSGAFVPTWLDEQFFQFIADAPIKKKKQIGKMVERKWDKERFEKLCQETREAMEKLTPEMKKMHMP